MQLASSIEPKQPSIFCRNLPQRFDIDIETLHHERFVPKVIQLQGELCPGTDP